MPKRSKAKMKAWKAWAVVDMNGDTIRSENLSSSEEAGMERAEVWGDEYRAVQVEVREVRRAK